MKIIYLTTAMEEGDFRDYITHWKSSPNPSNQNFHNKMIRCLAKHNEVTVISIRPFSRSLCDLKRLPALSKTIDGIRWNYIRVERDLFKKIILGKQQTLAKVKECYTPDSLLFVDTINTAVVHFAKAVLKYFPMKSVGIVTDSPSNISGTKKSYAVYLLGHANNYSGYVALTPSLNELYNTGKHPSIIIEGIAENDVEPYKNTGKPYFFFGGALMERYGIYNLIKAFKNFGSIKYRLLICGHHENMERLKEEIGTDPRIEYLGALPVKRVLAYEKSAYANINPRPYNEDLDRYSIPSKTIEYLASGSITISVKNTRLQKLFMEDAIWTKSGDVNDLTEGLKKAASFKVDEARELGKRAREQVLSLYSMDAVAERLDAFLCTIK